VKPAGLPVSARTIALSPTASTRKVRMSAVVHASLATLSETRSSTAGSVDALPSEYDGPLIRPVEPGLANERAARAAPNLLRSERLCSRRR